MIQKAKVTAAGACYIDSSAYVEHLIGSTQQPEVDELIRGKRWVSSVLLVLETQRTLVNWARTKRLAAEKYARAVERLQGEFEAFTFRALTIDICVARGMPEASTPRSLDLAHLRTALWFHNREPLTQFVTLDEQQRYAAKELGLPV